MAKSLRSKRKRKFRAIKRMKLKPKLDAKLQEIAIRAIDEKMESDEYPTKENSQDVDNTNSTAKADNEMGGLTKANEDIDMEGNEVAAPAKSSSKNAKVPLHLLSQRKLRKLQMKQKQKKSKKSKKFLKW